MASDQGGMFICRPKTLFYRPGTPVVIDLISDLHIAAATVDYARIRKDIQRAVDVGARLAINGDVLDAIVTRDNKRYTPAGLHPRLHGCGDILNKSLDWATELLTPAAHLIDMIGVGNHECHDSQTSVMTPDGWKLWPHVTSQDALGTFNLDTGAVEFQLPTQLHAAPYNGNLVTAETRSTCFAVTPNHRMLTHKNDEPLFTEAGVFRTIGGTVPLAGSPRETGICNRSDSYLALLGWATTDASWGGHSFIFYQRPEKVGLIKTLLEEEKATYSEKVRTRNITHICGVKLKAKAKPSHELYLRAGALRDQLVSDIGVTRRVPLSLIYTMSRRQFDLYLNAVVEANGTRHPSTTVTIYGRPWWLSQLQVACVYHGYRSQYVVDNRGDPRLYVNPKPTVTARLVATRIEHRPYQGMVYCATVPNGTLITCRRGKVLVSGNSAIEKHHNVDLTLLLVDRLNGIAGSTGHVIQYGGYCGFLCYQLVNADSPKSGTRRLTIFYHHGSGGGSSLAASASDYDRLGFVENVDVFWLGHRHSRMSLVAERISCPQRGDKPRVREVRLVRSGSYFRPYGTQSQESVQKKGRQANYVADSMLKPHGLGGARLLVSVAGHNHELQLEVTQ